METGQAFRPSDGGNGDATLARSPDMAVFSEPTDLADLMDEARAYAGQAKSPATLAIYRRDWAAFAAWCEEHGLDALPASPDTIALYLTGRARLDRPATLNRRVASLSQAHQAAGFDSPTHSARVRLTLQGIRRALGVSQNKKTPALLSDLRAMVAALPDTPIGTRDRALILVGWASAARRSELAALTVADLEFTGDGVILTIRRSKTDQEGRGRRVGVPFGRHPDTCPVGALRTWMNAAGIGSDPATDSPVFRSMNNKGEVNPRPMTGEAIAKVVKRAARRVGKDPARFAGHSLRSGLISETARSAPHLSEQASMAHSGHRSVNVYRGYVRDASLFRQNPAAEVGL